MNKKLEAKVAKLERLLKINEERDRNELGLKAMRAIDISFGKLSIGVG